MFKYHFILLNFSGICLGSLGSSCIPKKIRLVPQSIVVYVNSTPYCTSILVEHHKGPCHCECLRNASSCHARQQFLPDSCSCQCLPSLGSEKSVCSNSSVHRWDSDTCQCTCKHFNTCQTGHSMNTQNCKCEETSFQECGIRTSAGINVYIINLTVIVLVMLMVIMMTVYWLRGRRIRNSTNSLYQQANSDSTGEENFVINEYSIPSANFGNSQESHALPQRI